MDGSTDHIEVEAVSEVAPQVFWALSEAVSRIGCNSRAAQ